MRPPNPCKSPLRAMQIARDAPARQKKASDMSQPYWPSSYSLIKWPSALYSGSRKCKTTKTTTKTPIKPIVIPAFCLYRIRFLERGKELTRLRNTLRLPAILESGCFTFWLWLPGVPFGHASLNPSKNPEPGTHIETSRRSRVRISCSHLGDVRGSAVARGRRCSTTRLSPSIENVRFSSPVPVVVVTTSVLPAHVALETCRSAPRRRGRPACSCSPNHRA